MNGFEGVGRSSWAFCASSSSSSCELLPVWQRVDSVKAAHGLGRIWETCLFVPGLGKVWKYRSSSWLFGGIRLAPPHPNPSQGVDEEYEYLTETMSCFTPRGRI
jgi:hypothetical protein